MSITTKIGDRQTTRLLTGEELPKDDLRLEVYGTLDELVAHLGMARSLLHDAPLATEIRALQVDLFRFAGELACIDPHKSSWAEPTTDLHVKRLEAKMTAIETTLKLPRSFLVPGTHPASAALEVARTVSRRFERRLVAFGKTGGYKNPQGFIYANRLSDYCFLLARKVEVDQRIPFDAKDGKG